MTFIWIYEFLLREPKVPFVLHEKKFLRLTELLDHSSCITMNASGLVSMSFARLYMLTDLALEAVQGTA